MSVVVPKNRVYVQPVEDQEEFIVLTGETLYDIGAQTFMAQIGDFPEDWSREQKISYVRGMLKKHPQDFKFINLDPANKNKAV